MLAGSVINYAKHFIAFAEFYVEHVPITQSNRIQLCLSIDAVKNLKKKLSRSVSTEAAARRHEEVSNPPSLTVAMKFLRDSKVTSDLNTSMAKLEKANLRFEITTTLGKTWARVCRYLAAIIVYGHRQRPSVAGNLTMNDYELFLKDDGKPLYVTKTKTSNSRAGYIKLSADEQDLFDRYYAIRKKVCSGKPWFLLNTRGNKYEKLSQDLPRYLRSYKYPCQTATQARKAIVTEAATSSKERQDMAADYLSHGKGTSKKSYRIVNDQIAHAQHVALVQLQEGEHKYELIIDKLIQISILMYV